MDRAIAVGAVSLMLLTSSAEASEPKAQAAAAQEPQSPAAESAAARRAMRDPFKQELEVVLPPPPPQCGRLCEFDLEQLRVTALVTGISTPLAGVEAPNGKVYVVDRGTPIGKKGGRVVEVLNGRITVEEPCKRGAELSRCRTVLEMPKNQRPPDEDLLRNPAPAPRGR